MNNKRHNKIYFESLARLVLALVKYYISAYSFPCTVAVYFGLVSVPGILVSGYRPAKKESAFSPVRLELSGIGLVILPA